MTKFSFEVPLKHLNDFDSDQDYLLALSFLCNNKDYLTYHRNTRKKIILDNSYNEIKTHEHPYNLFKIAEDLHPDKVVCPDDDNWSLDELTDTYQMMLPYFHPRSILLVCKDTLQCQWAWDQKIPFCTTYEQRDNLPDCWNFKATHFLGLIHPGEVYFFKPNTCDTGMPIKLALEGKTIEEWIKAGYPHLNTTPDYFNLTLTTQQIDLAKLNIKTLKELANGPETV